MSSRSWLLFLVPVLIWSTTFYAITLQLSSVTTPTYAVALRFGFAAILLFGWLALRREPLQLASGIHPWVLASGLTSYGISYVLTYVAEESIPSGLVAIAYTLMVFLTPAIAFFAYRTAVTRRTWLGGSLGVAGVALCFLPDLLGAAKPPSAFVWGMVAMVVAALTSSVGAVCSIKLNRMQVPVVTYTAWAMMYGAIATALYGAFSGQSLQLDGRLSFWLAFLYLSVAGTIIAFLCYLTLLKHEGTARAMYISVLSPVGAVIVSVLWEGLRPQALTWAGILISMAGAWITLVNKKA